MIAEMSAELTDIESARELILARCTALSAESVPIADALNRTLAAAVVSGERVPGFDNSAMDGYAVRAADLSGATLQSPVTLRVADESRAGAAASGPVAAGEAIAISTGAVIPAGADAVVRVEDAERDGDAVAVQVEVEVANNIRRAGEDIEPGAVLLDAGSALGPAELGVLASVGRGEVDCRRRPTVAVLSTGDELIGVSEPMREGAVRNSNSYAVPALAAAAGAGDVTSARVGDDRRETIDAIRRGLASDVLVVCGGISVGQHDHVKAAFTELGVEQVFWGVSLKPGKPAWFGVGDGKLVFGLPGNPVSAYVTFLLFVRPALLALQGADPARSRVVARLGDVYEKPAGRAHAIRCRLELEPDGWRATPAPYQGSHVMTSLVGADALALLPAATTRVEAGEPVTVELLP